MQQQAGNAALTPPAGLAWRPVHQIEAVRAVLREGGRNRATASTAMNSSSSRSHAITTVRLAITTAEGKTSSSTIYLVDLAGKVPTLEPELGACGWRASTVGKLAAAEGARLLLPGSERVDKSEVVGAQLKEAQAINKSLSALGDVISSLQKRSAHIPFRNSKLTQVWPVSCCCAPTACIGGHVGTLAAAAC
jgi:hypothetical protein